MYVQKYTSNQQPIAFKLSRYMPIEISLPLATLKRKGETHMTIKVGKEKVEISIKGMPSTHYVAQWM